MASAQHSEDFYRQGKAYWETIPATIDGMLGGYSELSSTDVHSSQRLLKQFQEDKAAPLGKLRALDCGAGIGRITKHLLLPLFDTVDMVEQNQAFLDQARGYIGPEELRVDRLICKGLQDFTPEEGRYDVIWCQWVTGHLTDGDLVSFVQRCLGGLRENGLFVIKDNITQDDIDVDNRDGSITRPRHLFLQLFEKAGARLLADRKQYRFPKGLYEVRTFAMR